MEPRAVADAVETGEEDVVMEALRAYNRENCQSFTFDAAQQEDRKRLAELLVSVLEQGLPPSRRIIWLQSIRILSRDRSCLDSFTSRRSLQALACYAGISASQGSVPEPLDMDVVLESLKCLCNLVLSSPVAQVLAAEAGLVVRLAERVGLYRQSSFPHDVQFFDLRLLFLLTALRADVRQQLFQELQGVHLLTEALELTLGMTPGERPPELLPPQETERAMEILKVLFNITFDSIKREVDEEDTALYRHLGTLLRHCVMAAAAGDRTEEFHGHTVNLLGNLPLKCLDVLLTLEPHEGSLEFLGVNMDVIRVLLSFLEKRLHQVLPPLRDVRTRPEVGELLRNKLVRLMTHLDTDVKRVAAEFLFVLCSESVPRFIKYTGYGNAAGLLAARGLMAGGRPEGQYSEDEDTDTDEYKEAKASINPVTGRVEEKPPNPMEGMTEEQKEHEAMKLVNMFDKLSRHRVIQPMGMSPRGQLTSLQDAMCETMEGQLSSDPDSDPD
ncbi:chaperone Ric-8A isoform X2 [Sagmatias obliquidens]|uniref:Synembryn n=1 Tax=Tursiops truncatus TaxID=9739 RepID=A0A6J3RSA3_TURTR|nr:synembryn-A isoform X2 [Lagenorhynchus obliquidens]XP_030706766.1 synembryn-A isoform X2 [Globicephala melas]XP_033717497.1 synembryn-A isoform X2 [Tursiops truncatus]